VKARNRDSEKEVEINSILNFIYNKFVRLSYKIIVHMYMYLILVSISSLAACVVRLQKGTSFTPLSISENHEEEM
jgi:hypothetical protein